MREGAEETKEKAPISVAFAEAFREVFGEVQLVRVKEGDVVMGKPDTAKYATCFYKGNGQKMGEKDERRTNQR